MKVKDILKILKKDGWYEVKSKSSHIQLKHDVKRGRVTVPYHGRNVELPKKTLKSILQQAKIDLED
ncbi:MAG: type II toxin-antitoxin system HicA family toxin [Bacteroidales bacterium]|nr:type II toxin-antitoxin system HicA family toxin [Bacteroidales bacterium]